MHRALRSLLLLALVACGPEAGDGGSVFDLDSAQPSTYTVRRGDTLVKIAKAQGVTVAELRAWNGIEGDLIEVGQILLIWESTAAPGTARAPRASRPVGTLAPATVVVDVAPSPPLYGPRVVSSAPRLPPPSPKRCLAAAGVGLSQEQIRAALDPFVHNTSACIAAGSTGGLAITTEITVGCDGRVTRVDVVNSGGATAPVSACIAETLTRAGFPAHDLPDGQTFAYPITYRF